MKTLLAILLLLPIGGFGQDHPSALIFKLNMSVKEIYYDTSICNIDVPVLIGMKYDTLGFMFRGRTLLLYPVHIDARKFRKLVDAYAKENARDKVKVDLLQDRFDDLYMVTTREGSDGILIFINNLSYKIPVYLFYLGSNQDKFCVGN